MQQRSSATPDKCPCRTGFPRNILTRDRHRSSLSGLSKATSVITDKGDHPVVEIIRLAFVVIDPLRLFEVGSPELNTPNVQWAIQGKC
jgi:hypothetical protein